MQNAGQLRIPNGIGTKTVQAGIKIPSQDGKVLAHREHLHYEFSQLALLQLVLVQERGETRPPGSSFTHRQVVDHTFVFSMTSYTWAYREHGCWIALVN